jgi:hypothetical protein
MKERLVTLETAKLAKEKGFNWPCNDYHNKRDGNYISSETIMISYHDYNSQINNTSLPTQSSLQKWLREVHTIYINIRYYCHPEEGFEVGLFPENMDVVHLYDFKTYEEALEIGLQEALKLIK